MRKKIEKLLFMILSLGMGCLAGYMGGHAMGTLLPSDPSVGQIILAVFGILIMFYAVNTLHVMIHEVGHMICGLISGYEFCSIRFFGFMWVKLAGKIRLRRMSIANTSGQCHMAPPRTDGTSPVALYNWGGCLANVITAGIAFLYALVFWHRTFIRMVLMMFVVIGLGLAILNGVPLKSLSNDGYNALTLRKRLPARKAFERSLMIVKECSMGKRLKDMPTEWFDYEIGKYELDDNMLISMAVMTLNYHVDCKNLDKTYELSKYLLDHVTMVDVHKMIVVAEQMCSILLTGRDKEEAEKLLTPENKKLLDLFRKQVSVYRVWYIYELLYNGDEEKAKNHDNMFEKIAAKHPYQSDLESERELMAMALDIFQSRQDEEKDDQTDL